MNRQSIVPLITVNRLINNLSKDPEILKNKTNESPKKSPTKMNFHNAVNVVSKILHLYKSASLSRKDRITIKESEQYKQKMKEYEEKSMKLEPMVENRIVCIKNEEVLIFIKNIFINILKTFFSKALPRVTQGQKSLSLIIRRFSFHKDIFRFQ